VNGGMPNLLISSVAVNRSGTFLFIGAAGGSSTSASSINEGTIGRTTRSVNKKSDKVEVGSTAYGVWRRSIAEIMTGVGNNPKQIPSRFVLEQNYPNPFNPTTTISFSLPSKSFVSLKVFDLIGRDVATIVSEEISAGSYSRQWNATNMPSGVYFYRLQTGSFNETKKLVLLR